MALLAMRHTVRDYQSWQAIYDTLGEVQRDWGVIDKHVDSIHDLFAEVIRDGIEAGEFREQDPVIASRCFGAATVILCHPQMVAQCLAKTNRAMPDELIDYAIRALK